MPLFFSSCKYCSRVIFLGHPPFEVDGRVVEDQEKSVLCFYSIVNYTSPFKKLNTSLPDVILALNADIHEVILRGAKTNPRHQHTCFEIANKSWTVP